MSPTPLSSRGPDSSHHYGISSSAIIASTRNLRRFYENLHYLSVKIIALLHLQTHLQFAQKTLNVSTIHTLSMRKNADTTILCFAKLRKTHRLPKEKRN